MWKSSDRDHLPASQSFPKDARVRYSALGLVDRPKKRDVIGTVVGYSREYDYVRVRWDDRDSVMTLHPSVIELV